MVGGETGAQTGAKVGAVAGATRSAAQRTGNRNAMYAETQARAQYQTTAAYQSAPHSNFNQAQPDVMATAAPTAATAPAAAPATTPAPAAAGEGESIIRKNGRPVLAITYPSDWRRKVGDFYVSAVSADGQAYSAIATLDGLKDKEAGLARIKRGLDKYLEDIKYDEPTTSPFGALAVTGTAKAKKAGVEVVFAARVFDAGPGTLAGVAFIADRDIEDHYKEAARYICETIRTEKDFARRR
jgi:hypothetical protein